MYDVCDNILPLQDVYAALHILAFTGNRMFVVKSLSLEKDICPPEKPDLVIGVFQEGSRLVHRKLKLLK